MNALLQRFAGDEKGATSIEYGLIITFISLSIIVGATSVGTALIGIFQNVTAGF